MNSTWNEQQRAIRAHYLAVARELVRPTSALRDQELGFDRQLWQALGSSGLFGVHMPVQYGGQGLSIWEFSAALEGFSEGCQDMGVLVSFVAQVALVQSALLGYGSEEQRQRWLPSMISGDKIGCFAITEQGCGSDVRSLKLAARRDGSGYRLNGLKWNITTAPVADICMTFARLEEAGPTAISCFITETAKPGLVQSAPFELMGNRGTPIGSLSFDEVALDADSLIGAEGHGLRVLYFGFLVERIFTGVVVSGCMQPTMDTPVKMRSTRKPKYSTRRPCPSTPTRLSAASATLSKVRLPIGVPRLPIRSNGTDWVRPGAAVSLMKQEMALGPASSRRAKVMQMSATGALVMFHFMPLRR